MKLTFKNIKREAFSVDIEPSEKVGDLKKKIVEQQKLEAAPRLIYSGKILVDDNTVESYNIKESDHIICMEQKAKAAPVASQPSAAPAPPQTPAPATTAQTPAAPNAPSSAPSSAPAAVPATPTPAPSAPRDPSMALGAERQAAITNMESMGFERAQIEAAMRAAYNNPDRAVEYLLNGIPDNLRQQTAPQPQQPTSPTAAPPAPAQPAATATSPATQQGGDEPVNLFEAAAAASNRGGQPRGAGGAPAAGGPGAAPQSLEFLRDNPMFQQLRQLVQQQPQMLETVLQQVSASNPQLAAIIASNPDEFIRLLSEGSGDEGTGLPPGAAAISVTEEERDAIERLCNLGFDRDLVIQAYFACDKNEELAANFLFEHPDDGEEQG